MDVVTWIFLHVPTGQDDAAVFQNGEVVLSPFVTNIRRGFIEKLFKNILIPFSIQVKAEILEGCHHKAGQFKNRVSWTL